MFWNKNIIEIQAGLNLKKWLLILIFEFILLGTLIIGKVTSYISEAYNVN